jgi:predicted DNA-binding transcriptional regulator AlpA
MTENPQSAFEKELAGEELMNIREVGRFFGGRETPLSPATIWRWVKDGRLPTPIPVGGNKRWRRSECLKILDAMIAATKPPFKPGEDA